MKVKLINTEEVYDMINGWLNGHKLPSLPKTILPKSTFVCYNDKDTPVYSMCFYNTDSDLCWIGFQVSNPEVSKEKTKGGFDLLFKSAEEYARHLGYKLMLTTSSTPSVIGALSNNGFVEGDTGVNQYLKELR